MTIKPLTVVEVFADSDAFEFDPEQELGEYLLRGHCTPQQVARIIAEFNRPDSVWDDIAPIPGALKATWSVVSRHEPNCEANETHVDPDDANDLEDEDGAVDEDNWCTCERLSSNRPWDYLHAEPATQETPGALPLTWVRVYYPGNSVLPNYSSPENATEYVTELREVGWFDDAVTPEPMPGELLQFNTA